MFTARWLKWAVFLVFYLFCLPCAPTTLDQRSLAPRTALRCLGERLFLFLTRAPFPPFFRALRARDSLFILIFIDLLSRLIRSMIGAVNVPIAKVDSEAPDKCEENRCWVSLNAIMHAKWFRRPLIFLRYWEISPLHETFPDKNAAMRVYNYVRATAHVGSVVIAFFCSRLNASRPWIQLYRTRLLLHSHSNDIH